jgi:bile acid:Na+ symporter, BASS family
MMLPVRRKLCGFRLAGFFYAPAAPQVHRTSTTHPPPVRWAPLPGGDSKGRIETVCYSHLRPLNDRWLALPRIPHENLSMFLAGILLITFWLAAGVLLQRTRNWQPFSFSCWVLAVVSLALLHPDLFSRWGGRPASEFVPPLIQAIMFSMGVTLSAADFARVLLRPRAVLVGMVLQFTIMPLAGWGIAKLFAFPPEIAAGVILIGTCPGGVASNVITFLSRGDVALSVSMTACSTLLAPVMTPLWMSLLAGTTIPVAFDTMMWSIINIVILPTAGGLIVSTLLERKKLRRQWLDPALSAVAIVAICVVIGIIVAGARQDLLSVGLLVVAAAALHNAFGYAVGYGLARAARLSEAECRTISIEVGMQNGGMGAGLALKVLNSHQAALAPAIFGAWMSIAGSVLASYWRKHPPAPAESHGMACTNSPPT